jgi:hypothetical protein
MAIRIDGLPTGPIYVDNAAQESTLQELLRVMGGQANKQRRYDAETAAASRRTAEAAGEAAAGMQGVASASKAAASATSGGWSKLESGLNAATIAAGELRDSRFGFELRKLATTVADMSITWVKSVKSINENPIGGAAGLFSTGADLATAGLRVFTDAVASVASILPGIPNILPEKFKKFGETGAQIIGAGLKTVNSVLAKELNETIQNMATFNKMGASFSQGFMGLRTVAYKSGLTVEQFTKAVSQSEASIRNFGLPFAEGAEKVSEVSGELGKAAADGGRSLRDQLRALGYNTEEQIELASEYMSQIRSTMTTEQFKNLQASDVAKATKAYAVDLKVLQDITGKNAKAAMEEARQRSMQADIMSKFSDPKQAEKFKLIFATLPESAKKAFLQKISAGVVTDAVFNQFAANNEEAEKLLDQSFNLLYDSTVDAAQAQDATAEQAIRAGKKQQEIAKADGGVINQINTLTGALGEQAATINEFTALGYKDVDGMKRSRAAAQSQMGATDKLTTGVLTAQDATQVFANQIENLALKALPDYAKAIGATTKFFVQSLSATILLLTGKPIPRTTPRQPGEDELDDYQDALKEGLKTWINETFPEARRRARGGAVDSMIPYIVGEKGPEIRTFDAPGQIIPMDKLANNLDSFDFADKIKQIQDVFTTNIDMAQKELAKKQESTKTDLSPIKDLPTTLGQAMELALTGPSGLNQAIMDLKNQIGADNGKQIAVLQTQAEKLENLISAMTETADNTRRMLNEMA